MKHTVSFRPRTVEDEGQDQPVGEPWTDASEGTAPRDTVEAQVVRPSEAIRDYLDLT